MKNLVFPHEEENNRIAREAISTDESQGTIKLDNNTQFTAAYSKKYFKTGKSAWYWITLAIAVLTVFSVFAIPINEFPFAYLRNALGLIFIFFLPGFTLMKCLYKSKLPFKAESKELELIEQFVLSIGLSIALTSFTGLILYYTIFGYSLNSITFAVFLLTIVLANINLYLDFKRSVV